MRQITFEPPLTHASASGLAERYPLAVHVFDAHANRDALFRLRYRAYRAGGWLPDHPAQIYRDPYDDLPTSVTLGVCDGTAYVGALRLCFSLGRAHVNSLPCAPYYPEIRQLRSAIDGPVVEISRLAVAPELRGLSFRTSVYGTLVRAACLAYEAADAAYVLVATHQRLQAFYSRMLGFSPLAGPAPYPPGTEPIVMLGADIARARRWRQGRNAFFKFTHEEIGGMRQTIIPILRRFSASAAE